MALNQPDLHAKAPAESVRAAVDAACALDIDPEVIHAHLDRFTSRYVAMVAPRAIARQSMMLLRPLAVGEVRSRVTPVRGATDGRRELDIVAHDSPGLFSQVSGVVALAGGQVVTADAHTTHDGVAVDSFEVRAPVGVATSWWARFEGELVDAMAGRIALRAAVDDIARADAATTTRDVMLDVDPEDPWSRLRFRTGDRTGLLFAITDALAELRLDIVSAQVQTKGRMVDDVFVVRSDDRSALDAEQVRQVERGVAWAVRRLGGPLA